MSQACLSGSLLGFVRLLTAQTGKESSEAEFCLMFAPLDAWLLGKVSLNPRFLKTAKDLKSPSQDGFTQCPRSPRVPSTCTDPALDTCGIRAGRQAGMVAASFARRETTRAQLRGEAAEAGTW